MSAAPSTKKVTTSTDEQPVPPPYVAAKSSHATPGVQRNYLAMMMLAYGLIPTGLARVYIGDKSGKTRAIVFVVACVAMLVPILNLVAGLALFVLQIWGIIDMFLLRGRKTDANGQILAVTAWDRKWEKGLFIATIIGIILTILAIFAGIMAALLAPSFLNEYQNYLNGEQPTQNEQRVHPSHRAPAGHMFDEYQ